MAGLSQIESFCANNYLTATATRATSSNPWFTNRQSPSRQLSFESPAPDKPNQSAVASRAGADQRTDSGSPGRTGFAVTVSVTLR